MDHLRDDKLILVPPPFFSQATALMQVPFGGMLAENGPT